MKKRSGIASPDHEPGTGRRTLLAGLVVAVAALAGSAPLTASESSAPASPGGAAGGFALRDADRVVFYGDSITQDGGYARFVEEYVATRFPEWDVRFYNAGVGGDTVQGAGPATWT